MSVQAQAVAFRELASMFAAGVSLPKALAVEGRGAPGMLGQAFLQASQRVSQGKRLSEALQPYQAHLGDLCIELIRVGERSGSLQQILERLADYLERRHKLVLRLRSSLTYPAFIFLIGLAVVAALPGLLLGGLFRLLADLGANPPFFTRVLLAISSVVAHPATWVALAVLGLAGARIGRRILAESARRKALEAWLLGLPGIGPTLLWARVSLFSLAMQTLYAAGMPALGALCSAGRATGSAYFSEAAEKASQRLADGDSLAGALRSQGCFPPTLIHLVAAGEESGSLDRMLGRAAQIAQQELEHRLEVGMAALEPAMLLAIGSMVAVLVLGTVSPMISALEHLAP